MHPATASSAGETLSPPRAWARATTSHIQAKATISAATITTSWVHMSVTGCGHRRVTKASGHTKNAAASRQ